MAFLQMPAPPCFAACLWSACILWMHWVFVSKFAPANLQLQGSAITLETKAHIYTIYSSSLFEYPIVALLKFLSFALSSKPPLSKSLFFRWTFYRTAILPDFSISVNLQFRLWIWMVRIHCSRVLRILCLQSHCMFCSLYFLFLEFSPFYLTTFLH